MTQRTIIPHFACAGETFLSEITIFLLYSIREIIRSDKFIVLPFWIRIMLVPSIAAFSYARENILF